MTGILSAIFLFVLPFVVSRHLFFGASNAKMFFAVGSISVIALYFCYLVISHQHQIHFRGRWFLLVFALTLIVYYLAGILGVYPERSLWSDIVRSSGLIFLSYLGLLAFVWAEILNARDWSWLRRSVIISSSLFALLTFFGPEGLGLTGQFFTINFKTSALTFANTTFAGAYLVLSLGLTLIELSRSTARRGKIFFGILAAVQLLSPMLISFELWRGHLFSTEILSNPMLILGSARASGAAAIVLVIYVFSWWLWRRFLPPQPQKYILPAWGAIWAIGVLSVVAMFFVPGSFIQERYLAGATGARLIVWESGFKAIKERPLLGWGPENFRFAQEKYFDSRLYLAENGREAWFDRAHNIVVDTLVEVGVVGMVAIVFLLIWFIVTVFKAKKRGLIGATEANLLGALVFAHALQLQTGFDTIPTFVLLALILGYGLWLERQLVGDSSAVVSNRMATQKIGAVFLAAVVIAGSGYLFFFEYSRQTSLVELFGASKQEKQVALARRAVARTSDLASLRLASNSLEKGLLNKAAGVDEAKKAILPQIALEQLSVYEDAYKKYLAQAPTDYRARMNYAYLLMIKTFFGENRLEDAKVIIRGSYDVSANNPLTLIMESLVELYNGNLQNAKDKAVEAVALQPNADFPNEVLDYIIRQEPQFPEITVLNLENL